MALQAVDANAGGDFVQLNSCPQIAGDLVAGEDLLPVAPCYIKGSDGLVYNSNGTAVNEAAKFAGFTARAVKAGQAVTLFGAGARFRYAVGMTPGQRLFVAATAGRLDTAATTGGLTPVAEAVNSSDIRCIANYAG